LPVTTGRKRWLIDSERTQAWIARFAYRKLGFPIENAQLKRLLLILKGDAYIGPQESGDPDRAWEEVEAEPVLRAMVALVGEMNLTKKRWEGTTTVLLTELRKKAVEIGIWTDSKQWPAITQLLTFKLNKKAKVLKAIGIDYHPIHRRDGSWSSLAWGGKFCNCLSLHSDAGDAGDASERTATLPTNDESGCESDGRDAVDAAVLRERLQAYEQKLLVETVGEHSSGVGIDLKSEASPDGPRHNSVDAG